MEFTKRASDARQLIFAERYGTLATISRRVSGWPFGSITPYALTDAGEPTILISEIAEHTKNLRADARVSLLVHDSQKTEDPQSGARATLIGYAMPVPPPYLDSDRQRYLELFPNSESYFEIHDFTLFQIKLTAIRYIGGFGDIHWMPPEEIMETARDSAIDPLSLHSKLIRDHMNQDHAGALALFAKRFGGLQAESALMIHADSEGFDLAAVENGTHRHLRIPFSEPVTSAEAARVEMIELVRRAKSETD